LIDHTLGTCSAGSIISLSPVGMAGGPLYANSITCAEPRLWTYKRMQALERDRKETGRINFDV